MLRRQLLSPSDTRIWSVFRALEQGWSVEEVHEATNIDRWFLTQFADLVQLKTRRRFGRICATCRPIWLRGRAQARRFRRRGARGGAEDIDRRLRPQRREEQGLRSVYKRIDTCARRVRVVHPYLYSTYENECESDPTDRRRWSFWAADRTESAKASSSTTAAVTPRSRCGTPATKR